MLDWLVMWEGNLNKIEDIGILRWSEYRVDIRKFLFFRRDIDIFLKFIFENISLYYLCFR